MTARKLSILTAALLGLGMQGVASAVQSPNFYECSGRNVNLTLAVGSGVEMGIVAPENSLNLQIGKKNYTFRGTEVSSETTLIGDLWEVTLNMIPDLSTDYATVIIPEINLGDSPVTFKSQLVLTKVSTPFTGSPVEGVINASRYIDLSCSASMVYY